MTPVVSVSGDRSQFWPDKRKQHATRPVQNTASLPHGNRPRPQGRGLKRKEHSIQGHGKEMTNQNVGAGLHAGEKSEQVIYYHM